MRADVGGSAGTARSTARLRDSIRRALPDAAFTSRPFRALWFLPLVSVAAAGVGVIASDRASSFACVVAVLVVGNVYASMLLLSHEVMHGAIVRKRWLQYALSWIGFAPFLISPTLWRTWHNEVHHRHANEPERDPDTFAGEALHASSSASRWVLRLIPGSGGPASFVFPFLWYLAQGQIVLWYLSRRMGGFERLDRTRCKIEVAVMAAGWLALATLVGIRDSVLAIAAPMAVGNCILMSYIATNHLLRPLSERSEPLLGAMSVETVAPLDRLHFRFSHHVEHHLFPAMSGRYLPLVREWLAAHVADRFVCVPHGRAIHALYTTPRTYRDENTLVDPSNPTRAPIDLNRLGRELARKSQRQDQQTIT